MKPRFPETEIQFYAQRYQYRKPDNGIKATGEIVREQGFCTLEQLNELVEWKSPRSLRHLPANTDDFIREITGFVLNAKEEETKILLLNSISGVQWPIASAFLHFYVSDNYPILDFRALWSLGEEELQNRYSMDIWLNYLTCCQHTAKLAGVSVRTLDKALWQYSKENQ